MREERCTRIATLWLGAFLVCGPIAPANGSERIAIDGSTGVMPLAMALAKAFSEQNPAVTIEFGKGLGTTARLAALAEGRIDIALASHGLVVSDLARQGLTAHEVARTAVVFGVNASVPVSALTHEQICDLYAGKMTNWSAFGGPDTTIAPRTRPDSEVDTEVVRANIACLESLRMPEAVKVMPRSGDMARELAATVGAIGMTTMTVVEQSRGRIRALAINGIAPTAEQVERRTYPLVRESFFVTRSSPPPAAARFLDFATGPAGAQVIRANGAIPVR